MLALALSAPRQAQRDRAAAMRPLNRRHAVALLGLPWSGDVMSRPTQLPAPRRAVRAGGAALCALDRRGFAPGRLGIRGYGLKSMRVFDFGWQQTRKGWGDRSFSTMRLQMHATDPKLLEPRLGTVQSKGCIRIPATLNRLLDIHCLGDGDYERALSTGHRLWMLHPERRPTPGAGRYLIVLDSGRMVARTGRRAGSGPDGA